MKHRPYARLRNFFWLQFRIPDNTFSVIINNLGQSGSTIVNLNKTQFGKIPAIIPNVATMKSFDEIVGPMFESVLSYQKENIKLAELRDALLPQLMSGELAVSDLDL